MVLLILFAFVAGIGTALSPCVLPVLPLALGAGATGGKRRPLGIVIGLALSFTFVTVAFVYVIHWLGLPDDLLRNIAIAGLICFGIALVVPKIGDRLEAWLSRLRAAGGARPGCRASCRRAPAAAAERGSALGCSSASASARSTPRARGRSSPA